MFVAVCCCYCLLLLLLQLLFFAEVVFICSCLSCCCSCWWSEDWLLILNAVLGNSKSKSNQMNWFISIRTITEEISLIDKADCFLITVFLCWNGVFVGYIVFESLIVALPTVEGLKLFGNPLIPFLQSRAWGAPTSTPPKFAELRAIRNWKMPWKGRERSFKSWIPMQMPLPSQRRWKPFETSTSGGHWPKGHYHLKMWWNWRWKEPRSTEELELPNKFCALQISRGPSRVRRPELIRFFRKVRSLIAWPCKLCPKTLVL